MIFLKIIESWGRMFVGCRIFIVLCVCFFSSSVRIIEFFLKGNRWITMSILESSVKFLYREFSLRFMVFD